MSKVIKILAFVFLAWTVSLMITDDANAQSKKTEYVSHIDTSSPVFYFIYEKKSPDGEELGTVELQIHDRTHQFVSMGYDRLNDQAKGNDPKNPLIKLIQMPEVSPLAFRQAESLEELDKPVDGLTVISVRLNSLKEAARIIYP